MRVNSLITWAVIDPVMRVGYNRNASHFVVEVTLEIHIWLKCELQVLRQALCETRASGPASGYYGEVETRISTLTAFKLCVLVLELNFDDTFVKPYYWSSISQAYTRVLHAQDFPKRVAMDVYYNIY